MTIYKERLRNVLRESVSYALMELQAPPIQSDMITQEPINPDMYHLFNLNDVNAVKAMADNPDITFGEVAKLTGTVSFEPTGVDKASPTYVIGLPLLDLVSEIGHQIFGGRKWGTKLVIATGASESGVAHERTNFEIMNAPARGTQADFREVLTW